MYYDVHVTTFIFCLFSCFSVEEQRRLFLHRNKFLLLFRKQGRPNTIPPPGWATQVSQQVRPANLDTIGRMGHYRILMAQIHHKVQWLLRMVLQTENQHVQQLQFQQMHGPLLHGLLANMLCP